jgi:hypothetical protein
MKRIIIQALTEIAIYLISVFGFLWIIDAVDPSNFIIVCKAVLICIGVYLLILFVLTHLFRVSYVRLLGSEKFCTFIQIILPFLGGFLLYRGLGL